MLVLGIDPGTATTGYGLVRETVSGNLEVVDYGIISTSASVEMPVRLCQLAHEIKNILLLHHPDTGAVEKLFFARNVTTALSVGQARGVILATLAETGLKIGEYSPMEIKQAVTGYGGADKRQVQEMIRSILSLDEIPKPDDAADALAIAICHLHSIRFQALL